MTTMRVAVDAERCQGHNRCVAVAPELFDVDDLGNAWAVGDGVVAPELVDKARRAAANCPEHAVSLTEAGSLPEAGPASPGRAGW